MNLTFDPQRDDIPGNQTKTEYSSIKSNYVPLILTLCALVVTSSFVFFESIAPFNTSISKSQLSTVSDLKFTLARKGYDPIAQFSDSVLGGILAYNILTNYIGVIEPSVSMGIYVFDENDDSSYSFEVCKYDSSTAELSSDDCKSKSGSEHLTFDCDPYDEYFVTVNEYFSDGDLLSTSSGPALCIYVRRDISSLPLMTWMRLWMQCTRCGVCLKKMDRICMEVTFIPLIGLLRRICSMRLSAIRCVYLTFPR